MSLETQVADLVTATNTLTGTVNTKISDIDTAKNTAVATIATRISTFNSTDLPAMQSTVNSAAGEIPYVNLINDPVRANQASKWHNCCNGTVYQDFAANSTEFNDCDAPQTFKDVINSVSDSCCESPTLNVVRIEWVDTDAGAGWIALLNSNNMIQGQFTFGMEFFQASTDADYTYKKRLVSHTHINWGHSLHMAPPPAGTIWWTAAPFLVAGDSFVQGSSKLLSHKLTDVNQMTLTGA
jgi:hypothetical protein